MWHIPPCANDMECKQLENSSHGKTLGTRAFGSLPQIMSFKYIYLSYWMMWSHVMEVEDLGPIVYTCVLCWQPDTL